MRISDWSSDVCSSDLWLTVDDQWFALAVVPKQLLRALHSVEQCEGVTALRKPLVKCDFDGRQVGGDGGYGQAQATLGEIGRAACRARVCQYVETPGVAV